MSAMLQLRFASFCYVLMRLNFISLPFQLVCPLVLKCLGLTCPLPRVSDCPHMPRAVSGASHCGCSGCVQRLPPLWRPRAEMCEHQKR